MPEPGRRPLRFMVAGVWNTAFGFGVYLLCDFVVAHLGGPYVLALVPAHVLAVSQAWLVHRVFVFPDAQAGILAFLRYNVVYWVSFALNLVVLPLVVELAGLDRRLVQAGFIACVAVGSYLAHKRFSFRVG
jgi:putative flippase GtrA